MEQAAAATNLYAYCFLLWKVVLDQLKIHIPLSICTWFLKCLVHKIDFWTWFSNLIFKLDFLSISDWSFAGYTGSKNQVWNRKKSSSKIKLVN